MHFLLLLKSAGPYCLHGEPRTDLARQLPCQQGHLSVQLVKVNCSYAPTSADHCHALCSLSYHTLILFAEVEVLSLVYLLEALKAFLSCWVPGSALVFFKVLNYSITCNI